MSVIVNGMEMPENCEQCVLQSDAGFCLVMPKNFCGYTETDKRPEDCPLVALPDHHGRLVDADALIEFIDNRYDVTWKDDYEGGIKDACTDILEKIDTMPTIVEAEGEGC